MKLSTFAVRASIAAAAIAAVSAFAAPASAQTDAGAYPNKPIRIIVPFAPGGGNDIYARLVGAKIGEITGHNPIIENRPAAGGRVAAEFVAAQPPDGYTLYIGASGNMSIARAAFPDLPYHPTKTFQPVTMIADFPLILLVPNASPAKSVAELVALAKANESKATYSSASPSFTLASELLKLRAGMPGVSLPVKGSAEMIQCVAQDLCMFTIVDAAPAIPQVLEKQVRALAITGAERLPQLPDVPSMTEAGFPDVNVRLWSGVLAPAGAPPALAARMEALFRQAVADEGVSAKLKAMASRPGAMTSVEFSRLIEADIAKYQSVVDTAKLTFQ